MNVKIWNEGPIDYKEMFKGELIEIPRGKFIEMGRSRGVKFMSQFAPFQQEGSLEHRGIKRLRIEEDPEEKAALCDQPFLFKASDGKEFRSILGAKNYEESLTVGKPNAARKPNRATA